MNDAGANLQFMEIAGKRGGVEANGIAGRVLDGCFEQETPELLVRPGVSETIDEFWLRKVMTGERVERAG